jgi:hypothetical protein
MPAIWDARPGKDFTFTPRARTWRQVKNNTRGGRDRQPGPTQTAAFEKEQRNEVNQFR